MGLQAVTALGWMESGGRSFLGGHRLSPGLWLTFSWLPTGLSGARQLLTRQEARCLMVQPPLVTAAGVVLFILGGGPAGPSRGAGAWMQAAWPNHPTHCMEASCALRPPHPGRPRLPLPVEGAEGQRPR